MEAFDYVFSNNVGALREYLEHGEVNITNERGLSLLHYAIIFNNVVIFDLLLENYANVNIQDKYGDTPLHYCVINDRLGFVKGLINHGADVYKKNKDGQTPLYKACSLGREKLIYLFLETMNFDVFERDKKEETIFMALIRSRNLDLIKKVKLNEEILDAKNYIGETALHIATKNGDIQIINYLIDNKAFVNAKNKVLETPLFYAITNVDYKAINALIKAGAVLDCKSSFGETIYNHIRTYDLSSYINEKSEYYKNYLYHSNYPLHYAIIIESVALVKKNIVLKNIYRKDQYGYTPLELAKKIGNPIILELIENQMKMFKA